VKGNQPALADTFEPVFPIAKVASFAGDSYVPDEKKRGRQVTRYHIVSELTEEFQEISYEWPSLKKVRVVMSCRQEGGEASEEPMIRHYISSADLSAKNLTEAARQHCHIEAKLH
tara:strand:- start:622 stop:966 length:345 start_codon:yes stop_codon:yes gene_type:complete